MHTLCKMKLSIPLFLKMEVIISRVDIKHQKFCTVSTSWNVEINFTTTDNSEHSRFFTRGLLNQFTEYATANEEDARKNR